MLKKEEIKKIANLARIELSNKDIQEFSGQLSKILDYVNKVQNYSFSSIKPKEDQNSSNLRKDEIKKFDGQEIIKQFSDKEKKLLKVKKIL